MLLSISLFLSTLVNHLTYTTFFSIILLCVLTRVTLSLKEGFFYMLLCVFINASALYFVIRQNQENSEVLNAAFINNYLYLNMVVLFSVCLLSKCKDNIQSVERSLDLVIKLHLISFFLQAIVFGLGDYYIDFVNLFTGVPSRFINYDISTVITKYRMTGWYVEPSTYSSVMTALIISKILLNNILGVKKNTTIYIGIFSIIATFSTAAFFYGGLIFISFVIGNLSSKRSRSIVLYVVAFLSVSLAICLFILPEVVVKLSNTSSMRYGLINYLFEVRDGYNAYFGYGLYGVEKTLYNLATSTDSEYRLASLNDAGLLFYLVVKFGYAGFLIVLLGYVVLVRKWHDAIYITALYMTKLSYIDLPVIIAFTIFYFNKRYCDEIRSS